MAIEVLVAGGALKHGTTRTAKHPRRAQTLQRVPNIRFWYALRSSDALSTAYRTAAQRAFFYGRR